MPGDEWPGYASRPGLFVATVSRTIADAAISKRASTRRGMAVDGICDGELDDAGH